MYALRAVATRALFQSVRQISTSRQPALRISNTSSQLPVFRRSFHQSWRAFTEEEKKTPAEQAEASPAEAEGAVETTTTEPSTAEQIAEIKEESIATAEVADAAPASGEADSGSASVVEKAQEAASGVTEAVSSAASAAADTARRVLPQRDAARSADQLLGTREQNPGKLVYVGNLFFEVTAPQLEAEFRRYGEITNTRVVTDSRGLSKGFGFVEFASQEDAEKAIKGQSQKEFHGRRMAVQFHVARQPRVPQRAPATEPSTVLFIGNMSYQMSDRDLNDLFREIRNVLDVRVAIDRRTGQPRGFAHADFIDVESAQRAKEYLEKKVVYGRQLRVDYSSSNQRSNPPRVD